MDAAGQRGCDGNLQRKFLPLDTVAAAAITLDSQQRLAIAPSSQESRLCIFMSIGEELEVGHPTAFLKACRFPFRVTGIRRVCSLIDLIPPKLFGG